MGLGFLDPGLAGVGVGGESSELGALGGYEIQSLGNPYTEAGVISAVSPTSILPQYGELLEMSGDNLFGSFGQDEAGAFTSENPVFAGSLNTLFAGSPAFSGGGFDDGDISIDSGVGQLSDSLGQAIPEDAVSNALDFLQNSPSGFDQTSGGPIVELIAQRGQEFADALTDSAMVNLEKATEIALSNDLASGLLSGSTILMHREKLANQVLLDLNSMIAGNQVENTKFLYDMAMQDIQFQSNNMQAILQLALTEKGVESNFAKALASIASNEAITQVQIASQLQTTEAQIGADVYGRQLGSLDNQRANMLNLLELGQRDFQFAQENLLDTTKLPLEILLGLDPGQVMKMSSFSL
jgi:hypothetical protein